MQIATVSAGGRLFRVHVVDDLGGSALIFVGSDILVSDTGDTKTNIIYAQLAAEALVRA